MRTRVLRKRPEPGTWSLEARFRGERWKLIDDGLPLASAMSRARAYQVRGIKVRVVSS